MKATYHKIRSGYDGRYCLVHARCTEAGKLFFATAQMLDVRGCDLFSGIMYSISRDGGMTFDDFRPSKGLAPIKTGDKTVVPCDATPMYHKGENKILVIGQTAEYEASGLKPTGKNRRVFYSVFDKEGREASGATFLEPPEGYSGFGCGSGQCFEEPDGSLLVPVNLTREGTTDFISATIRYSFDGRKLRFIEMGSPLAVKGGRGLYEPSLLFHDGQYIMTMRNDLVGYGARSSDGLHFTEPFVWRWDDGEILPTYNTQQHLMKVGEKLALVYTRRGANNDHVLRHRAPLFAAYVNKNLQIERKSEIVVLPERGARLGNFSAISCLSRKGAVMAAEWMQPEGCERYGSDNSVFLSFVEE